MPQDAEPSRRAPWWRRRRSADVIDLRGRDTTPASETDEVIARLTRLRDTGIITNAEFEAERRALLGGTDQHR